jgi:hypothetical protein
MGDLSPRVKWQSVNLTTHLHLLQRLRMCGGIRPLPHKPTWRAQKNLPSFYSKYPARYSYLVVKVIKHVTFQ